LPDLAPSAAIVPGRPRGAVGLLVRMHQVRQRARTLHSAHRGFRGRYRR